MKTLMRAENKSLPKKQVQIEKEHMTEYEAKNATLKPYSTVSKKK